jgi:hypothetical protein
VPSSSQDRTTSRRLGIALLPATACLQQLCAALQISFLLTLLRVLRTGCTRYQFSVLGTPYSNGTKYKYTVLRIENNTGPNPDSPFAAKSTGRPRKAELACLHHRGSAGSIWLRIHCSSVICLPVRSTSCCLCCLCSGCLAIPRLLFLKSSQPLRATKAHPPRQAASPTFEAWTWSHCFQGRHATLPLPASFPTAAIRGSPPGSVASLSGPEPYPTA